MTNPKSSQAYRRAHSSTNARGREWLTRMVSDPYVKGILDFERIPGYNFGTLWVVTDPGSIHAYSIPLTKSCDPSYLGNIEQFFRNHTRRAIRNHTTGFWTWQASWLHRMRCWLRHHGLTVDCNTRIKDQ